jgi:O-antigen ligase
MFEDHPLLGVGAGNYTKRYGDYSADLGSTLRSFDKFGGPYYPHSTPVEILAETGLLGFFAFGAVVLMAFASLTRAFRSFTRSGLQTEADLAIAVGLGLIGYLTTSLLLHAHHVHTFWLLVTLAGAARQVSKLPPRRGAS